MKRALSIILVLHIGLSYTLNALGGSHTSNLQGIIKSVDISTSLTKSSADTNEIQVTDLVKIQDTVSSRVVFKLHLPNPNDLINFVIKITDQAGVILTQKGPYDIKTHSNGFLYVEASNGEKKTIMNNDLFYTIIINPNDYTSSVKLNISYVTQQNSVAKSETYLIVNN